MSDKPMITLQVLLKSLADKIDQYYADQIEQSSRLKLVDLYEARAIEAVEKIEAVMQLAERFYPTEADTDLVLLQFQATPNLLEACETIHEWLGTDDAAQTLPYEPPWYQQLRAAIAAAKGATE